MAAGISEVLDEQQVNQRIINIKIIKAIWKCLYGNYGKNRIQGNENDLDSFYVAVRMSKETIRQIEMGGGNFKVSAVYKHARQVEMNTGISSAYLCGEESLLFKELGRGKALIENMDTYFKYMEKLTSVADEAEGRKHEEAYHYSLSKLESIINKAKNPKISKDLETYKKFLKNVKIYEEALYLYAKEILYYFDKEEYIDGKLHNLVYYIKYKKKFSGVSVITYKDIMRVLEETTVEQLQGMGEALSTYINVLEKHLELAKAVYIIEQKINKSKK